MEVKELSMGERAGTSRGAGVVKLQCGEYPLGGLDQRRLQRRPRRGEIGFGHSSKPGLQAGQQKGVESDPWEKPWRAE